MLFVRRKTYLPWVFLLAVLMCSELVCVSLGQSGKHTLSPAEDVGLTQLYMYGGVPVESGGEIVKFSPDSRYFVVVSETGNLETNRPEDVIWLFSVAAIEKFLTGGGSGSPTAPVPLITVSPDKEGPFITDVRWLPDSSGIVFKQRKMKSACCSFQQLFLLDIQSHNTTPLTPSDQDIDEFDVNSRSNYVYTIKPPRVLTALPETTDVPIVQTGKTNVGEVLFPGEHPPNLSPFPEAGLWLVRDGKPRQIVSPKEELPRNIRLSPDSHYLLGVWHVQHPPAEWAKYKEATAVVEYSKGHNTLSTPTSSYFLFDFQTGSKKQLFNAPTGEDLDWDASLGFDSRWSSDGSSLMLANVFLPLEGDSREIAERQKHPYVAVYRLRTGRVSGLLPVRSGSHSAPYFLADGFFQDSHTVVVKFDRTQMKPPRYVGPSIAVFRETSEGRWSKISESDNDPRLARFSITIEEKEGINLPPTIVATEKATGTTYKIWDPNPQLKNVELGEAKAVPLHLPGFPPGQEMGLVFPPDYIPGKRYPLVIQTHGFFANQFLTSGIFSTPFAARAMAARGIIVAQIGGTDEIGYELFVAGMDAFIEKLSTDGLIDLSRVGAIGFSSPVRGVVAHMAFGKHRLAAAEIMDGVDGGYLQSTLWMLDDPETRISNGGTPFGGDGLKNWLQKSPLFNTDKMHTPLLILDFKPIGVLEQWEEYSNLYQQHKPVDFITLPPPSGHPSTNPKNRLYCETFAADWFDFWLNNHEDPDPAKAEQYKRWRDLKKLQAENEKKMPNESARVSQ